MAEQIRKRPRGRPKSAFREPQGVVQALDRGLVLLKDLSVRGGGTLSDLSLRLGMPASTAHRLLATLQRHGLVELQEDTQEWLIGIEALRVGSAYLNRTNLVEASRPVLHRLMEDTGETANLGIADKGDVVFVSQVETHKPIRAFFRPGTRGHMHCSGIGKALLSALGRDDVEKILRTKGLPAFTPKTLVDADALFADLEDIRTRGWSLDDEERYLGMRCVAAPIFNTFGEAVAGVSISGPTVRMPDIGIGELGPQVARAAAEITAAIGGRPGSRPA